MNDKPILFSTEMVKAILEDRKTQTRRIIKSPFKIKYLSKEGCNIAQNVTDGVIDGKSLYNSSPKIIVTETKYGGLYKYPYKIGQKLWIRETWIYETENGIKTG